MGNRSAWLQRVPPRKDLADEEPLTEPTAAPSTGHIQPLHRKEKQLSRRTVREIARGSSLQRANALRGAAESSADKSARGLSFPSASSESGRGNEEDFHRCFLLPIPSTSAVGLLSRAAGAASCHTHSLGAAGPLGLSSQGARGEGPGLELLGAGSLAHGSGRAGRGLERGGCGSRGASSPLEPQAPSVYTQTRSVLPRSPLTQGAGRLGTRPALPPHLPWLLALHSPVSARYLLCRTKASALHFLLMKQPPHIFRQTLGCRLSQERASANTPTTRCYLQRS